MGKGATGVASFSTCCRQNKRLPKFSSQTTVKIPVGWKKVWALAHGSTGFLRLWELLKTFSEIQLGMEPTTSVTLSGLQLFLHPLPSNRHLHHSHTGAFNAIPSFIRAIFLPVKLVMNYPLKRNKGKSDLVHWMWPFYFSLLFNGMKGSNLRLQNWKNKKGFPFSTVSTSCLAQLMRKQVNIFPSN